MSVRWDGYFSHPLGLPSTMEYRDYNLLQLPEGSPEREKAVPTTPPPDILQLEVFEDGHWHPAASDFSELIEDNVIEGETGEQPSLALQHPVIQRRADYFVIYRESLRKMRKIVEARKMGDAPLRDFTNSGEETSLVHDFPVLVFSNDVNEMHMGREMNLVDIDEQAQTATVAMGSASGALYLSVASFRTVPLTDVYVWPVKSVASSCEAGRIAQWVQRSAWPAVGTKAVEDVQFKYFGKPLEPKKEVHWLFDLFGGSERKIDQGSSVENLFERLSAEHSAADGSSGCDRSAQEVALDLAHFCVCVGGVDYPVFLQSPSGS
eukprot:gnl/MRDRNA2_/MRDRNA2_245273_c0_seq1.p1 gnl/MRDRNA2_/MRDRNA2_245273_c0~~gnl/MRDRNA2_/MRDRNA2_245273_c0_seq1.p1  ORF type:complete len:336 (+),score=72.87 gnl/MRDRNA2_/MRDRNA2_245273_c0_seq1:48-1010(+)